jgi:hypothetical protein
MKSICSRNSKFADLQCDLEPIAHSLYSSLDLKCSLDLYMSQIQSFFLVATIVLDLPLYNKSQSPQLSSEAFRFSEVIGWCLSAQS